MSTNFWSIKDMVIKPCQLQLLLTNLLLIRIITQDNLLFMSIIDQLSDNEHNHTNIYIIIQLSIMD